MEKIVAVHPRTLNAPDRRQYPRKAIPGGLTVGLQLEVSGHDNAAVLLTKGMAADISHGGVRCAINVDVPPGTWVEVRFSTVPNGLMLAPLVTRGRVVRTESVGGAPERIAIVFVEPLQLLEMEAEQTILRTSHTHRSAAHLGLYPVATPATGGII